MPLAVGIPEPYLPAYALLPAIWGGAAVASRISGGCSGQLFGLSGLSGPTNESDPLVAVASDNASLSLLFCALRAPRVLRVHGTGLRAGLLVATSEVILSAPAGARQQFQMVWAATDLLAGFTPAGTNATVTLVDAVSLPPPLSPARARGGASDGMPSGAATCVHSSAEAESLALCSRAVSGGTAWGLAMGGSAEGAAARASSAACSGAGCAVQLPVLVATRLRPYAALPDGGRYQPLLAKALSVMRVNALGAEGKIRQRWSTPDRTPHRYMWLWDSCYHSLAANHLDPTLGWEYVASVLAAAAPDGAIAIERTPASAGAAVDQTQPPLLVWAVHENWRRAVAAGVAAATVRARLEYAQPRLAAYLRWDLAHRSDATGRTPLLRWKFGTESGMDNSPRFDLDGDGGDTDTEAGSLDSARFDGGKGGEMGEMGSLDGGEIGKIGKTGETGKTGEIGSLLAVDFSVFMVREAKLLAELSVELGNRSEARFWRAVGVNISRHVHALLWDEATGLYYDRYAEPQATPRSNASAASNAAPTTAPTAGGLTRSEAAGARLPQTSVGDGNGPGRDARLSPVVASTGLLPCRKQARYGWPHSAAQAAGWPMLAEAWGSLGHDPALRAE